MLVFMSMWIYRQLRARKTLMTYKDVLLRTRRALSLYKVYGDSALLVLNGMRIYRQLRARKVLMYKDVLLRTRRALSLYKVYGGSAVLVLNGTSLNSVNALLALCFFPFVFFYGFLFLSFFLAILSHNVFFRNYFIYLFLVYRPIMFFKYSVCLYTCVLCH